MSATATFTENEYGYRATLSPDPTTFKTKAAAAKALKRALDKIAEKIGYPATAMLITPESPNSPSPGSWGVSWEDGPYEWAIQTSYTVSNEHWHTEPYYSFDLFFYD